LVALLGRRADVVYATSMVGRTVAGTLVGGAPLVAKVSGDPAFERSRRRGMYRGSLEEFQRADLALSPGLLRSARTFAVRRAERVVCASEFFRRIVLSWGVSPERVTMLPNAMPVYDDFPPRDVLRARFGLSGMTVAFAGRLTRAKALEVAIGAVAELEGVSLVIAGTGEERSRLEALAGPGVRFLGPLPRRRVVELFAAADAALLSSSWETGRPHAVVEPLSVGTPVIATRVGGVPEVVADGVNGLLVEPGDPRALAAALRRFFADEELRRRLAEAAAPSVAGHDPQRVFAQLEQELFKAAERSGR
jgi:glycosyltransferase involved in cell wall biosynthesis